MVIQAKDAVAGKTYYSPKGIPCKVAIDWAVSLGNVALRSEITGNTVEVLGSFLLDDKSSVEEITTKESAVPLEKPAESSAPVIEKVSHKRTKTSLNGFLFDIMSKVLPGQSVSLAAVLTTTHEHPEFTDMVDEKIITNLKGNTLCNLKIAGITFAFDKSTQTWTRN